MSESNVRCHDGSSKPTLIFETACVLVAYGLVLTHVIRIIQNGAVWHWGCLAAIPCGWIAADFASGFVHWLADTWGKESMPWIGPRFLRPFRVHHVAPESFVHCKFMDTNGDTALVAIPFLLLVFLVPVSTTSGFWSTCFFTAFCFFALPTNQIHQWAHMRKPPYIVQVLQRYGLILTPVEHARHHSGEHCQHYCITSGFCNQVLEWSGFFRLLEAAVTRLTGIRPRDDKGVTT